MTPDQKRYSAQICARATASASKAMKRYPQPNYVLTKVAEEAGEVVKAGVHFAEGRDFTWEDLEDEVIDTIAMCLRLLTEGDQVIVITPPETQSIYVTVSDAEALRSFP